MDGIDRIDHYTAFMQNGALVWTNKYPEEHADYCVFSEDDGLVVSGIVKLRGNMQREAVEGLKWAPWLLV